MDYINVLKTIAEFLVGGFIIWGFFNEEKFVRFERRIFVRIQRVFNRKTSSLSKQSCTYNVIIGNGSCNKTA